MAAPKATKQRVNFNINAPKAHEVFVAGSFNDWDTTARPLKRGKNDSWRTWMNLPPGTYEYLYVIDGEWFEDPACGDRRLSPYGTHNSVLRI